VKLYVGNLPYNTSEDDLKELFGSHGTVTSVSLINDRETGRSKGFGFVEFENDDDAKKAIEALNGSDFSGRALVVNEARPKTDRPERRDGGSRGNGDFNSFRKRSW
jgi:RNA recognition motif-containing protein